MDFLTINRNGGGVQSNLSTLLSKEFYIISTLLKSGGGAQNNLCSSFNDFRGGSIPGGESDYVRLASRGVLCQH